MNLPYKVIYHKYCNGVLKFHDHAKRTIRGKYGVKTIIRIERTICTSCGRIRRVYPEYMLPYKQYEKEIIEGVKEGLITCETLGYEDYVMLHVRLKRLVCSQNSYGVIYNES